METLDRPSAVYLMSFLGVKHVSRLALASKKWLDWSCSCSEVLWQRFFESKFGSEPDYIQLVTSKSTRRPWKEHYMRTVMSMRVNIKFEAHPGMHLTPEALRDLATIQYKRVDKCNGWFYAGIAQIPLRAILGQLTRKLHVIFRKNELHPIEDETNRWWFNCHLGFKGQQLPFNIPTGISNVHGDRAYYFRGTLVYDEDYYICHLTLTRSGYAIEY